MFKTIIRKIIYFIIEKIEKYEYRNNSFKEDNPYDKIINILNVNDYEIETDYGFVPFSEINLTSPLSLYRLELENGDWLECADDHIVFTNGHEQKFVRNLTTDDYVLCKDEKITGIKVKSVTNLKRKVSMVDLTVDTPEMSYYSNNILSHNTVSAAITILHYALFNNDKGIMIVANKGKTVEEIVDKIKNIYMLLPFFLKRGVVNWNLTSIIFDNGCRIKTEKRTKEPAIGFTIDLLYLDEFAHIPANIIEPYYTAVVPILSSVHNSRMIITSTPKGMNLFYKLLIESELPHDDPNWNGFHSLRIYWWQMKGRRDTKIFLNETKMKRFGVTRDDIKTFFNSQGCEIYEQTEDNIKGIFIKFDVNNDKTAYNYIAQTSFNNIPIAEFARVTNWEMQQTKIIGGEDGFKQEYDLQFLTGNKLLFDSAYIEELYDGKLDMGYYDIPKFNNKLSFPYNGLQFIKDQPLLFDINEVKKYNIFVGIDLAEGLGGDYTVFNIFRLLPKTEDEIKKYKNKLLDKYDYFKLEQIGVYKTNIYSVEQVAHILYLICFELFDSEKVRIVLERNTYGDTLLAHMPNVFNQENDYSNHIFLRYKSKAEDKIPKMGLKVNRNKGMLIKDYQINSKKGNVVLHDKFTIQEVTTFTKHDTASGEVTFKSESGHDDHIMSCITLSSCFSHVGFRDSVDLLIESGIKFGENMKGAIDRYTDDKPDISTISTSYSKIYKNTTPPSIPFQSSGIGNNFSSMMKKQFGRTF